MRFHSIAGPCRASNGGMKNTSVFDLAGVGLVGAATAVMINRAVAYGLDVTTVISFVGAVGGACLGAAASSWVALRVEAEKRRIRDEDSEKLRLSFLDEVNEIAGQLRSLPQDRTREAVAARAVLSKQIANMSWAAEPIVAAIASTSVQHAKELYQLQGMLIGPVASQLVRELREDNPSSATYVQARSFGSALLAMTGSKPLTLAALASRMVEAEE